LPGDLGISTNNQAEAYALLQGLLLAKESSIKSLIIIGDSSIIIKSMVMKSIPSDNKLALIIARINKEVNSLHKVSYFQVLREFNSQANSLANEATSLNQGALRKNGG
jgi:ribonuclease HI